MASSKLLSPTQPRFSPSILHSPDFTSPSRSPSSSHPGLTAVYNVDARSPEPTQLEVTPITKYASDPALVLGRQIAVNRRFISYGLKMGAIRVLNVNTVTRALFRGHTQRVSDMVYFAEDVDLLASASTDGRIYVWRIYEDSNDLNKPQMTGKAILAIEIVADQESVQPCLCWHSHKQEILFVGIGRVVLRIDTSRVGRGQVFPDEPLKCHVDKLIDGIQVVGKHDDEVTCLSISQWMRTRLVSSSKDGMVKIWDDRKEMPLATLIPHGGQAVNSVAFLTAPQHPDHVVLITAGPVNREVKLWVNANQEGWLSTHDSELWKCSQTLELKSSAEPRIEEAFFNHIAVLPLASLIVIANAKKNAIYAVHVDYGQNPASTHMDYVAEFAVTMPILSLTATSDCFTDREQVVQVYCVQTQAIQQYALDLTQCLPPPINDIEFSKETSGKVLETRKSDGCASLEMSKVPLENASPKSRFPRSSSESSALVSPEFSVAELSKLTVECKLSSISQANDDCTTVIESSSEVPGPDVPGSVAPRSPSEEKTHHKVSQVDSVQSTSRKIEGVDSNFVVIDSLESSSKKKTEANQTITSEKLSAVITPVEKMIGIDRPRASELPNPYVGVKDIDTVKYEVKTTSEKVPRHEKVSESVPTENKERTTSLGTGSNTEIREFCTRTDVANVCESQTLHRVNRETVTKSPNTCNEEIQVVQKSIPDMLHEAVSVSAGAAPIGSKEKKEKGNQSHEPEASSSERVLDSENVSSDQMNSTYVHSLKGILPQINALHETLNQVVRMQNEMQKLYATVVDPVAKEGKRMETALTNSMEKAVKANIDSLWTRLQEENDKIEKLESEKMQDIMSLTTNCFVKEMPAILGKALKKEFSSIGPSVVRSISPAVEKNISSTVGECFQRSVGDKPVNQLEKSVNAKLEATVAKQIQSQFQTAAKQSLQEALNSTLQSSALPAFEQSCKTLFMQVDTAFQQGMAEHTVAAQQQFQSNDTTLAVSLREAINSIGLMTKNLTGELAKGQRKILELADSRNQKPLNLTNMQQVGDFSSNLHKVEVVDPVQELRRLISNHKYEEAFAVALHRSDVSLVSWLCSQVDLRSICSATPLPLSQGVLLALLQQLACDLNKDTLQKLEWLTEVATVIESSDQTIVLHVRPILEQVYQILIHQKSQSTTTPVEATSIRLILHVINSVLMSCK